MSQFLTTSKKGMTGNAAINNLSASQIVQFKENNPEVELGYLPILSEDGSKSGVGFCGYQLIAMGASSKHKDQAWDFMKFLLSDEIVWGRTETFGYPVVKKTLEEKYLQSGDQETNQAILNYVENGKGKAAVSWVSIFNKYVSVAYEEVINGKKTAEQALTDAETALKKEIS